MSGRPLFTRDNLPKLDATTGAVLKTRPMLATLLLEDRVMPAPWGGELRGIAGVDAYMVQAMNNGKGSVDAYFNDVPQMFSDYHVIGQRRADEMSDEELAEIFEDLPERMAHIRMLFGPNAKAWVMRRTRANQTLLGRALEGGVIQTVEGPVEFDEGAYINEDSKQRIWPIDPETFDRDYEIE